MFALLGEAGLLGLPYPEELGGCGQPYEVYLQALEEIAAAWMSVGVGVSRALAGLLPRCATFGTPSSRKRLLPEMLGGDLLGAYCLSEPQAGSDIAAMRPGPSRDGDEYVLTGTKAWITHGGAGRLLHGLRPHRRRRTRGRQLLPASRRPRRAVVRRAGAEDGPDRLDRPRTIVLRRRAGRRPTA